MPLQSLRLCLVTNLQKQSFTAYKPFLLQAIQGGITSIQLREKTTNPAEFHRIALEFKSFLTPYQIPLFINDHVDIAKEIDADGVWLGQSDLSPIEARKILGPKKIIGWSVESLEELERANQLTCIDCIAASAVFPSKSKQNTKKIWGLEGLHYLTQQSRHPVIAIGGINKNNVAAVVEQGAFGAAVIGAIHDHPDPTIAACDLMTEINLTLQKRELCLR